MLKVLIVEDHPLVSISLNTLLQSSFSPIECESVPTAHKGLAWLNGHCADIVLLDINLPDMSGIEFCKIARSRFPNLKILAVTSMAQRHIVEQMFDAGVNGLVLKNADTEEIITAIREVLIGKKFIGSHVKDLLKHRDNGTFEIPMLTRREIEVLKLIADGLTNAEIAEKLFLGTSTVDSHRKNMLMKFNVPNTAALVRLAVTSGLIG